MSPRKPLVSLGVLSLLVAATVLVPTVGRAPSNCGVSNGHTFCVSAADTLTGEQMVTVTNSPNSGLVIATWVPSGKAAIQLIQTSGSSPTTNDYSFVWPTQKYLDSSGTLSLQARKVGGFDLVLGVKIVCEGSMERTRP